MKYTWNYAVNIKVYFLTVDSVYLDDILAHTWPYLKQLHELVNKNVCLMCLMSAISCLINVFEIEVGVQ